MRHPPLHPQPSTPQLSTIPVTPCHAWRHGSDSKNPCTHWVVTVSRLKTPGSHPHPNLNLDLNRNPNRGSPRGNKRDTPPPQHLLPSASGAKRLSGDGTPVRLVRRGTEGGTGATSKTPNVHRPWYGGTAPAPHGSPPSAR